MDRQVFSSGEDAVDEQILVLLRNHRRLTFLALADALPFYTWQTLFAALSRLRGRHPIELLPLATDYEVVWRQGLERLPLSPQVSYLQVR